MRRACRFPECRAIIIGHNDTIAWGMTNVGPDVQDSLLRDDSMASGTAKYSTPTGWAKPTIRKEKINVRGNLMKPDITPVDLDVMETRNGPVITDEIGKKYALKWTARDPKNLEFEAFFQLKSCERLDDFQNPP